MARRIPKRPIERNLFVWNEEQKYCLDTPERALEYCKTLFEGNDTHCVIEKLIEDNDQLTLALMPMDNSDGALKKIGEDKFEIQINSNNIKSRQRFTMAHEFAHYQLHRTEIDKLPPNEKILFRDEKRDFREYAANQFAAELLMPTEEFLLKLKNLSTSENTIEKLSEAFEVSKAAVSFRAQNLGVVI